MEKQNQFQETSGGYKGGLRGTSASAKDGPRCSYCGGMSFSQPS